MTVILTMKNSINNNSLKYIYEFLNNELIDKEENNLSCKNIF